MVTSKPRVREHTIPARGGAVVPVYKVLIHPAEDVGGYWAECPMAKGGCIVQGDTVQETQKLMLESVAFYLEDNPSMTNYCLAFDLCDA